MIYQDSFAANYILTNKSYTWHNLRGGRQAYTQGDLTIILWTGAFAAPKRLRWECEFKGEPLNLKHPARIFRALASNARDNFFRDAEHFKNKFPAEYEKFRIQNLKSILKIQ